jgi:hypothetical protein
VLIPKLSAFTVKEFHLEGRWLIPQNTNRNGWGSACGFFWCKSPKQAYTYCTD